MYLIIKKTEGKIMEKNTAEVINIELVDATKSSLRQAMRAACLHEEGTERLKVAGEGISGVLHRTAVEVLAHVTATSKKAGIPMPDGESLAVYFCEALADAEASQKEESSPFKHMQKLPRAWINAKSQLVIYFEYDKVDFTKHPTVSKVKDFNKIEKAAVAAAKAGASNAEAAKQGLSLVPPAADDAAPPTNDGSVDITKSEATQKDVTVTQVDTHDLDPLIVEALAKIAASAHDMDATKALKMISAFEKQLSAVAKSAMAKMAANG
jgi:hypothetical protein